MPIRPENRARYPDNWPAIRAAILARAGGACEGSPRYPDCVTDPCPGGGMTDPCPECARMGLTSPTSKIGPVRPRDRPGVLVWFWACARGHRWATEEKEAT